MYGNVKNDFNRDGLSLLYKLIEITDDTSKLINYYNILNSYYTSIEHYLTQFVPAYTNSNNNVNKILQTHFQTYIPSLGELIYYIIAQAHIAVEMNLVYPGYIFNGAKLIDSVYNDNMHTPYDIELSKGINIVTSDMPSTNTVLVYNPAYGEIREIYISLEDILLGQI